MDEQLVYKFTPEERAVIQAHYNKYLEVLQLVANLRGLQGNLAISRDFRGFVRIEEEPSQGA